MLLTAKEVAREGLLRLRSNLVLANLVNRDYSSEFQKKGDVLTIRRPAMFNADDFNGTINIQAIEEQPVALKLDKIADVSTFISSKDRTLSLENFMTQIGDGAMLAISEKINKQVALTASHQIPNYTGVSGTTPATLEAGYIDPMVQLNELKVPLAERYVVMNPQAQGKMLKLDVINNADKSGTTEGLRMASIGRVMQFDSYMDQAIVTHTAGGFVTLADVTVTAVTYNEDDYFESTLTLTSAAGTAVTKLLAGDLLEVDGVGYVVTTDTTAAVAGVLSGVKVYPRMPAVGDLDSADVTFADATAGGHVSNIAAHKNCLTLATRPLDLPIGYNSDEAYVAQDPLTGLAVRVVFSYDSTTKKQNVSFDVLYGVKATYPILGSQILG